MLPGPLWGGVVLGWAMGANDAANVFGTAVASRIVKFRNAALLCGLAAIVGAYLQGEAGIGTYRELAVQSIDTVTVAVLSAALTVTAMTILSLPISTSQAIVGAIAGIGLASDSMNWLGLQKIVICWVATPIGAMLIAYLLYYILGTLIARIPMSMLTRDKILWLGLLIVGIYGSYALGANNMANATGIFSGQFAHQGVTDRDLALLGGVAIALGTLTFSKRVMLAVGSGIMSLDAFTALVSVLAMAVTVHVFAIIGVPVSTSQGMVGAILGIGFVRGGRAIDFRVLRNIFIGWLATPAMGMLLAAAGHAIFCE